MRTILALIIALMTSTTDLTQASDLELDSTCGITQAQLDAEVEASGGYEITAQEYCDL